jgi:hypothetical protein
MSYTFGNPPQGKVLTRMREKLVEFGVSHPGISIVGNGVGLRISTSPSERERRSGRVEISLAKGGIVTVAELEAAAQKLAPKPEPKAATRSKSAEAKAEVKG